MEGEVHVCIEKVTYRLPQLPCAHIRGNVQTWIPVPHSDRLVKILSTNGKRIKIYANRPADIHSSNVLNFNTDQVLESIHLSTDLTSGPYGTKHEPETQEWCELFKYLTQNIKYMKGKGEIYICHNEQLDSHYNDLLTAIPKALPDLLNVSGLKHLILFSGRASANLVLTLVESLKGCGYGLEAGRDSMRVEIGGRWMKITLANVAICGGDEGVFRVPHRRESAALLLCPKWHEQEKHEEEEEKSNFWTYTSVAIAMGITSVFLMYFMQKHYH